MMRRARGPIWVFMLLLVVTSLFVGCDNRPTASKQSFGMYAEFRALHLEDERQSVPLVLDTAYLYLFGSGLSSGLAVSVNGSSLSRVGFIGNEALYAGRVAVDPGKELRLEVSNEWRSTRNEIVAPKAQPRLVAPVRDSVHRRDQDLVVRWTGADTGMVFLELSIGGESSGLGDTLWTAGVSASDGMVVIPASIWAGRADTTAVLSLWYMGTKDGEGFEGGLFMLAGLGVRSLIRVRPPGTAEKLVRRAGGEEAARSSPMTGKMPGWVNMARRWPGCTGEHDDLP